MNLPTQSTIKATGRPVSAFTWTDPRTGEPVQVNDFGNCNGIRKVKGFPAILAEQKREVKAERKRLAAIRETEIKALLPLAKECTQAFKASARTGAYYRHDEWAAKRQFIAQWHLDRQIPQPLETFRAAVSRYM